MALSLYFGLYFIMFFSCITLKCLCPSTKSTGRHFGLARFVPGFIFGLMFGFKLSKHLIVGYVVSFI